MIDYEKMKCPVPRKKYRKLIWNVCKTRCKDRLDIPFDNYYWDALFAHSAETHLEINRYLTDDIYNDISKALTALKLTHNADNDTYVVSLAFYRNNGGLYSEVHFPHEDDFSHTSILRNMEALSIYTHILTIEYVVRHSSKYEQHKYARRFYHNVYRYMNSDQGESVEELCIYHNPSDMMKLLLKLLIISNTTDENAPIGDIAFVFDIMRHFKCIDAQSIAKAARKYIECRLPL